MTRVLKNIIKHILPGPLNPEKRVKQYIQAAVIERKVLSGPFKGMNYTDRAMCSSWCPKILGTYEKELWPWIDEILQSPPEVIIDVGAAEGYYAVGFACKTENTKVIAFEAVSTDLLKELIELNGVTPKITVNGLCHFQNLNTSLSFDGRKLLFMDTEGAEAILLDPEALPELKNTQIIAEIHDCFIPGISDLIKERFKLTHKVEEVHSLKRVIEDFPLEQEKFSFFNASAYYVEYLNEKRPGSMSWLNLRPTE